jgi:formylglycine-generating enzyme required for sulfatase activity
VPYAYKIGKYDVTNSQYVEFLNAKDPTGANSLRIFSGGPPYGGITYSAANVEGSKYSVIAGKGSHPVNFVTWYSAVRFTNWLNNGQGDGDTETGAYTLGPLGAFAVPLDGRLITRNAGATVFLPSENEWYKAAYFDPRATAQGGPPADGHYWLYPTASNTPPTASDPTAMENHANYYNIGYITTDLSDVGAYTNTTSPYGAFDMGGNVWQWNEELITTFNSAYRGRRGGSFSNVIAGPENMRSSARWDYDPRSNGYSIGIRVASVPEPNTGILTIAACVIIWFWRRR